MGALSSSLEVIYGEPNSIVDNFSYLNKRVAAILRRSRGTNRGPPRVEDCIFAEMDKGDAFIMLASAFHGGGTNSTKDQYRLVFATFATRGFLRQEENQFLSVPLEVARQYNHETQAFIGYSLSDPACGYVDQVDPIFLLRPELKAAPKDF